MGKTIHSAHIGHSTLAIQPKHERKNIMRFISLYKKIDNSGHINNEKERKWQPNTIFMYEQNEQGY